MNVKPIFASRLFVAALFLAILALPTAAIASAPRQGPVYATPSQGGTYATPSQGGTVVYTVQPGDDLFRLALRFGTTVVAIQAANNLPDPSLIFVGQSLAIPLNNRPPTVQPGTAYIVQQGDDLFRLALRFGTTVSAIQAANGITDPNLIFVGQSLVIPTGTGGYGSAAPNYATGTPNPYATPAQAPTLTPTSSIASAAAPTIGAPPSALPNTTSAAAVSIVTSSYRPATITVPVGTTVTWTNNDSIQHTVTSGVPNSPSGLFDSGTLNTGQTFSFTFTSPGTYSYYCRIHGAAMTGTVTVTP